jgi:glycosyltransferase involved in cell wall biosynthesis
MNYKKNSFFAICIVFAYSIFSVGFCNELLSRPESKSMTTSVLIPCCKKHFSLLENLLGSYEKQTCLPDEIVISLSDVEKLNKDDIDRLENLPWSFDLKIIKKEGKESAGQNRNIAYKNSKGDVIIYQDADDLPHPQRVELIKYLFENYYIDHLMHTWIYPQDHFKPYIKEKLILVPCATYNDLRRYEFLHNGNVSMTREVADKIVWESVFGYDRDVEFNMRVYQAFKNKVLLRADLIIYRNSLSAFAKEKN